jgi:adenine-specific DNA-methyltransferase
VRVKSSTARKGPEKKLSSIFRQLRLTAADVILCYGSNRTCLREDIRHADHVCELSEEYAFRALCLWLVTTYGSSVYSSSIKSDVNDLVNMLSEIFVEAGEYPFVNDLPDQLFNCFYERAKTLLQGSSPQVEILGSLYEHIHKFPLYIDANGDFDIPIHIQEKDKRRLVGQFYTPSSIVDYCFERALEKEEPTSLVPTILDPSCGTGNFLLGAVRLIKKYIQSGNEKLLVDVVGACLYGLELDGRAASIARVSVMIALTESWIHFSPPELKENLLSLHKKLRNQIKNMDTLYSAPSGFEHAAVNFIPNLKSNLTTRSVNFEWFVAPTQFALVITNPPYVSFGARNQPKLIDGAATYLRHKFPNSAEYKIRIHSIFQEIALRYAGFDGLATLLVPDGFLTGGYYKKLRQLLLAQSQLQSFAELAADTVPGAVVGRWCVATYKRNRDVANQPSSDEDYSIQLYSHIEVEPKVYCLQRSVLVSRDQSRFRLVFNDIDRKLCKQIDALSPLSSEFQGRTGIRALNGQGSVVASEPRGADWRRGITSGSSVQPHVVTWAGAWLHIDSSLLYKGGFDAKVIENPKILIRQTGDRLIAAFDDSSLYHLNNVHSLNPRPESRLSLHFIDGLLNSSFWLYLYRLKTREQGRALAQVDIETLESMPLPKANQNLEKQISALTILYRKESASESDIQQRLSNALDKLVYDIYELDDETVQQIEGSCGKLSDNKVVLPTAIEMLSLQNLAESEEVVCRH